MTESLAVPVGRPTLIQHINAKLAFKDQAFKMARGAVQADLGEYYIVDLRDHSLVAADCNPEQLAREMGIEASGRRRRKAATPRRQPAIEGVVEQAPVAGPPPVAPTLPPPGWQSPIDGPWNAGWEARS